MPARTRSWPSGNSSPSGGRTQRSSPPGTRGSALRPTLRAGQLGIMVRDGDGKVRRLPGIGWFDTDQGRYATTVKRGSDGGDWISLAPADNARLTHRIAETLTAALRG